MSLLATSPLILVSPRLVSCAPWAFARLACSAHGRMRPLKELNQTLLSAPCVCKRRGLHSHLDSANSPNEQKTLFCALKEQSRQAYRAATDKSWRFWKYLTTIRQALCRQTREWAQKTSSLARDLARKEVIGIHWRGNGRTSHDAGCWRFFSCSASLQLTQPMSSNSWMGTENFVARKRFGAERSYRYPLAW